MAVFTVIDHTELGAAAASWTKGSIPSSYDHLYLVASTRSDEAVSYAAGMTLQVGNSGLDTGTNYSHTRLYASTATPASNRFSSEDGINYMRTTSDNMTADTFGTTTVWIPNYANTANYKQIIVSCAAENASATNAEWELLLQAGLWSDTPAAITDVGMDAAGNDFMQYSTFTLYGVTGA